MTPPPVEGAGPCLLLFVKAPLPGHCKTRLATSLGAKAAAELASAFVDDGSTNLQAWYGARMLVCEDAEAAHPLLARLVAEEGWGHLPLPRAPLGALMGAAFQQSFRAGFRPVLAVGADMPNLTAEDLVPALRGLGRQDAVLGPSMDGGYYLLGLKAWIPEVFVDIPWSTPRTLTITLERLRDAGHTFDLLPVRRDIDTPEDLLKFLGDPRRMRCAPRTVQAARRAGLAG